MHELDFSTGRAGIAYVGDKPWHGYGQELTEDAPIEVWSREAGLNWALESTPVLYHTEEGNTTTFPDRVVLRRSDTKEGLSIVSNRYIPVQPAQILEFFRDLVEVGGMKLHTAGSLKGGRRIWALAKLEDDFELPGGDKVEGHLLLATGCDGTIATISKFTGVRVVCANTMHIALLAGDEVRVLHNRNFDPNEVKAELGLGSAAMQQYRESAEVLAARKVNEKETQQFAVNVFGNPKLDIEDDEQPKRVLKNVLKFIEDSPGSTLPSAQGTAWGLLNGVTFFVDHQRKARNQGFRLESAWFGKGANQKQAAYEEAMALAGGYAQAA